MIQTHHGNVNRMQSFVKENFFFGGGGNCVREGFFFFLENVKRYLHSSGGLNQTLEHVSAISALITIVQNNLNKLNVTSISDLQINSHYKDILW